jgi:DNA-binding MarR family transcriptional regulator
LKLSSVDGVEYRSGVTMKSTAEQSGLDQIAGLLFGVAESTRRSFEAVAASFDLTPAQARALLALEEAAPMRSLAEHLHCDASNVTGIADRLEARGLVVREAAEGDRRVKLLAITPAGTRLRARMETAMAEASPIMSDLTASERETLRRLLAKAIQRMYPTGDCEPGHDRVSRS